MVDLRHLPASDVAPGAGAEPADRREPSRRGERGTGLIGSTAGALAFVGFLLFAVQVTTHLGTTSTVTAAGYDAARAVASRRVDHGDPAAVAAAQVAAERNLRLLLGDPDGRVALTWSVGPDTVRLRITTPGPDLLPEGVARGAGLGEIDRTFVVRIERSR